MAHEGLLIADMEVLLVKGLLAAQALLEAMWDDVDNKGVARLSIDFACDVYDVMHSGI